MRIVHLAPFYHPVIGGVEKVVRKIAEYTASKGIEVYVLTYNRMRTGSIGFLPKEETINDVHVIRVEPDVKRSHGSYSARLPDLVSRLRPDIVHAHVWRHPHVFQVAKLKKKVGFKAILHGHAPFHGIAQLGMATWLYHRAVDIFRKHTLDVYDRIVALTPYEKRIYTADFKQLEDKVAFIPNGIDDEIFRYQAAKCASSDTSDLLYIGRVCKERNLELAVKALRYILASSSVKLVIAGPDEGYTARLSLLAKKMKVIRNLKCVGPVYSTSKYKLYASSKVFIDPCIYEAFGLSLLEAQAFGKPCVITGMGGQVYVAPPGKTSIHAKPRQKSYAEGIMTLLTDKRLYQKLSSNALKWAKKHKWSAILRQYDVLYSVL